MGNIERKQKRVARAGSGAKKAGDLNASGKGFPKTGSGLSITTKGRYGLRVMVEMAARAETKAVALRDLSQRLKVSEKYLWHVAHLLASKGLIRAERGAHGGYRLARAIDAITLLDIVEALEGPCRLVPATEHGDGPAGLVWRELETALVERLRKTTLRGILERYDAQTAVLNYVI